MSVRLTKIIEGKPAVADDLNNEVQVIQCPRCEQTYRLGYSDTEWHRVKLYGIWASVKPAPRFDSTSGMRGTEPSYSSA